MDHVGPLCRSVEDAAIVYDVAARPSPHGIARRAMLQGLRVGVLRGYFRRCSTRRSARAFEAACDALREPGRDARGRRRSRTPATSRRSTCTSCWPRRRPITRKTLESRPDDYTPNVRLRLEMGRYILAEDYVRALRGRDVLIAEVDAALRGRDGLLLPSLPVPAVRLGAATVKVGGVEEPVRNITLRLTQLFNVTGHPAITIPCGRDRRRAADRRAARRHDAVGPTDAALGRQRPIGIAPRHRPARYADPRCSHGSFHAWEHRLASATKDRVVRPFDWGVDWIPPTAATGDAGRRARRALGRRGHARHARPSSTPPPTRDFDFTAANGAPSTLEQGEAGTLRFPSALVTPHPENNIVVGRWFPPRDEAPSARRAAAAAPSSCCRSGTRTRGATSACRGCWRDSASRRCASACPITMRACRPSSRAPTTSSARTSRGRCRCAGRRCSTRGARSRGWPRSGLRADRHPRHQPRLVPGDADVGARAADPRAGAQPRVARGSPTSSGEGSRRGTCAGARTVTSISSGCGACGGRSARSRTSIASARRRRCSSTRPTT